MSDENALRRSTRDRRPPSRAEGDIVQAVVGRAGRPRLQPPRPASLAAADVPVQVVQSPEVVSRAAADVPAEIVQIPEAVSQTAAGDVPAPVVTLSPPPATASPALPDIVLPQLVQSLAEVRIEKAEKAEDERYYVANTWENLTPTMQLLVACVSTEVTDGHREQPRLEVSRFLKLSQAESDKVLQLYRYQQGRVKIAERLEAASKDKRCDYLLDMGIKAYDEPSLYYAEVKRNVDEIARVYYNTKPGGYLVTKEDVELAKRVLKERVNASPALTKVLNALDRYVGEDFSKEEVAAYPIRY